MSAFISIVTPAAGYLFTDGAGYDAQGVLQALSCKASRASKTPFAVTSLGNAMLGEKVRQDLVAAVDVVGVDGMFADFLPDYLMRLKAVYRDLRQEHDVSPEVAAVCVQMVAFSPTKGAVHAGFQTIEEDHRPDTVPFQLRGQDQVVVLRGREIMPDEFAAIAERARGERDHSSMARRLGIDLMEKMRTRSGVGFGMDAESFTVGGHIDMATISENGATTQRVRVWPDKIGERISPAVVEFASMNRKQRRAAKRRAA